MERREVKKVWHNLGRGVLTNQLDDGRVNKSILLVETVAAWPTV